MDNLLTLLKSVAPALATAVGGPLGGAAVAMIADKLGLDDKYMWLIRLILKELE